MRKQVRRLLTLMVVPLALLVVGCDEPGPAEQAGEKLDEAAESIKDTIEPDGPAEKAGEEIDEAVDNVTN
ncbi:MAG TPA: hypothetical protein VKY38_08735 [Azoarcus sp.]|nr:hypothetical protein [Azoarcus sp.]